MISGDVGLAAAQRALANGDADGAFALLASRRDPPALHLRALALRRAGRLEEAGRDFEAASAAAPHDPQVANNFANLLRQVGEPDKALRYYDRALALLPDYRDAAFNKALLLSEMGLDDAALVLLERLSAAQPADSRAHSARGAVLRKLSRHRAAASAFDAALDAQPSLRTALKGRAQIALECGEEDAADRFRRALSADANDLDVLHGYVEALEAAGRADGITLLENALKDRPGWIAGHVLLARSKAEQGDPDWAGLMRKETERNPANRALAVALAAMLAAAEQWEAALAALPVGDDPGLTELRAHYLSEAGDPAAALALIGPTYDGAMTAIVAARAYLRLKDPLLAARILEGAVARDRGATGAWGLLEIAWRLTGDRRSVWLSGREGLVAVRDLGLDEAELIELGALLRDLHRTRAHPIGQSLRGGTQTRGALFLRSEPAVARLHQALSTCIAEYQTGLPGAEEAHPLLRYRDTALKIGGSWSVRLTGSGFHVNHIHPEGVLSSACYIALPDLSATDGSRPGWLELGRPPAELGLDVEPLAMIEPRVGHLALFPSYLFHGTRPFGNGERLTVAFDVIPA
ncbi:putative 2OG-Fe(II) oxygenase [Tsuneonella troitsensis]|uniref:putative 2OG-Fe(II) oxygenase n=1 Tax=Tsuneonella troitsensis TaxID=292222 RepID=UPI00070B7C48|nr:putative 2OG-Fe(II) oxygenase [Tsuneonella troitsensis]